MSHEGQFAEWDMSHFSSGSVTNNTQNWPAQPFFVVYNNIINNLAGFTH